MLHYCSYCISYKHRTTFLILRVDHGKDEFVKATYHINGIESFWGLSKTSLTKFKGVHKKTFYLHFKESEFRFNYRNENLYKRILKILKNYSLNLPLP